MPPALRNPQPVTAGAIPIRPSRSSVGPAVFPLQDFAAAQGAPRLGRGDDEAPWPSLEGRSIRFPTGSKDRTDPWSRGDGREAPRAHESLLPSLTYDPPRTTARASTSDRLPANGIAHGARRSNGGRPARRFRHRHHPARMFFRIARSLDGLRCSTGLLGELGTSSRQASWSSATGPTRPFPRSQGSDTIPIPLGPAVQFSPVSPAGLGP